MFWVFVIFSDKIEIDMALTAQKIASYSFFIFNAICSMSCAVIRVVFWIFSFWTVFTISVFSSLGLKTEVSLPNISVKAKRFRVEVVPPSFLLFSSSEFFSVAVKHLPSRSLFRALFLQKMLELGKVRLIAIWSLNVAVDLHLIDAYDATISHFVIIITTMDQIPGNQNGFNCRLAITLKRFPDSEDCAIKWHKFKKVLIPLKGFKD